MSHHIQFIDESADPGDPLDTRSVQFDWEELERAMGEAECDPPDYPRMALAIDRILRWIVDTKVGRGGNADCLRLYGTRVIGLLWVLNPDAFDGRPSLRELAKSLGAHRSEISRAAVRFSRDFGIKNREQHGQRRVRNAQHIGTVDA
jgi:hypothetical protein